MEYAINTESFFISGFIEDKKIPTYPDYRAFDLELTSDDEKYEIKDCQNMGLSMDLAEAGQTIRIIAFSPKKKPWYQIQFLMKDKNGNYNQNYILIRYEVSDKEDTYIIKRIIFLFCKNFF